MAADPSRNLKLEENQSTSKPVGTLPRRVAMEGYLLKRSETLRRWNQRWFSLDPTTAKMEYRTQRDELQPRGYIVFDVDSTVLVSPINFHGAKEYENCCFYIATPRKKDYYLCAETPAAARAWVATIRAACLVLEAHKDAVSSLTDGGRTQTAGAVKAAAASAAAIAVSHAKDIAVANQKAVLNTQQGHHRLQQNAALMKITSELQQQQQQQRQREVETDQDRVTVMRETLRVKDEELQHLLAELRARDATIRDMASRLSQTAEAAEAAAAAAHEIDRNRTAAVAKIGEICKDAEAKLEAAAEQVKASSAREAAALVERDRALAEAAMWRGEAELAERLVRGLQAQLLAATRSQDNANVAASKVTGAAEVPHGNLVPALAPASPEPGPVTGMDANMVVASSAGELQVDDTRNGTLPVDEPDNGTSASVSGISSGNNCTAGDQGSDDEHPPSPGYTKQSRELPKSGEGIPVSETDVDALSDKGGNSEARTLNPQGRANTNEVDSLEELDLDVDFLQPALVQMKVSVLDQPAGDHAGGGSP